jgi:hypothetical protein
MAKKPKLKQVFQDDDYTCSLEFFRARRELSAFLVPAITKLDKLGWKNDQIVYMLITALEDIRANQFLFGLTANRSLIKSILENKHKDEV